MKTFDQYMAESGNQSTLDQLRATGKYDSARSQYDSSGSYGNFSSPSSPSPSSSNQGNFQDTVQQAIEMNRKANEPAVQSLQASLPEVSSKFDQQRQQTQAQIEPLKQRYQNLLADVKGQGQVQVNNQTRITNNELGKRGLVGSSTLAQQEIQNAVQPIQGQIATNTKNIGLEQEQGLLALQNILGGLTSQETEAKRAVQNAIAQLQAGAGQAGVQQGLSIYQQNQQNQIAEQARKAQADQLARENALQDQLFPIQLQSAQADLQSKLKANQPGAGGMTIEQLFGMTGGGASAQPSTGLSVGRNTASLIAQGKYQDALNLMMNP